MKMKRRVKSYVMAAVAALGLASSANAAALDGVTVSLNFTEMPVPGATNLTRYVVSVHRTGVAPNMAGLDLQFTALDGDLFQLWPNYAGGAPTAANLTVFNDSISPVFLSNPAFIPLFFPSLAGQNATGPGPVTTLHDTQWLFPSSGVLGIAANNTESQTTLKGTFAVTGSTPTAAQDWVIASIVRRTDGLHAAAGLPDGDWTKLGFSGKIGFVGGGEANISGVFDATPVIDPRGRSGAEALGTDPVDGGLDGNPDTNGGFSQFEYGDPTSEGRVGINNWHSNTGIYNVYLDVQPNDGSTLADLLAQLNGDLDGTNGTASLLPQGLAFNPLAGYDIVVSYNGFPVPGGSDGSSAAFEFDFGDVGSLTRIAVPVPAAGWAGMALLAGMGLRRARKSS